ncbi:MAG: UDP-N-acetylmuramate dehydrogenase [Marinobacter sp.]|uniref:UDP-N-acetylmuramate dehydrogenase n=1 Tax=unclassified Marinobacter TaxID=83889 RepID=UPI00273AA04F|nr:MULTISPECIES: UDP-N-acetylmuramate dehydrogenase [unclassified Marinobacter]MDP4546464.1 UDP-N-acetylmuramate dehydrogenase [Marinobacter sp. MDS2]
MSYGPQIREQVSLKDLNTMAIAVKAEQFVDIENADQLVQALDIAREQQVETLVLGGGSNLVFAGNFEGLVLHIAIRGRRWEQVTDDTAVLALAAGENWHDAVLYAARSGYRGIENLALIPGTAGAAPVQNIGAYGVELCDTLESVTALDCDSRHVVTLSAEHCQFAYRDSFFKRNPGRYIILEIRLRLSRTAPLKLGYRDLQDYLSDADAEKLSPLDVAEAVMAVRRRKLPDPETLPNTGSFFKNPVIDQAQFEQLQKCFPDVVFYPLTDGVKLAAAWLIDQAGWKGFRNARVGIHNRQALVLINHSQGTGQDVLALAEDVRESVREKFGVELEVEPGIVGAR